MGAFFSKIGGIFFKLGEMWANVLVEFKKNNLTGGIFFKLGAMGANVLLEFEKEILTGGIFLNWGHFF